MPEFIQLIPPQDALARWFEALGLPDLSHEELETIHSLNRVTAEDVIAQEPLPAFHRTNVDGYAVRAAIRMVPAGPSQSTCELWGKFRWGMPRGFKFPLGEASGFILAECFLKVQMQWSCWSKPRPTRMDEIEVYKAVGHGENVLFRGGCGSGADGGPLPEYVYDQRKLWVTCPGDYQSKNQTIAQGQIISSGDEVIPPHHVPKPGQVRDINSYTLASLVEKVGGTPQFLGIIPDSPDILEERLAIALRNNDMMLITAGSSASTRDFTASVIARMGKPGVLVHGVNIKPGKPTILAVCDGKPVIGMPGNPVSALVIAHLFVQPMVEFLSGLRLGRPVPSLSARLSVNIASQAGREDYIPVRVIREGNGYAAEPIFYKSNFIFTLASADGLIRIPPDATGISAGEPVEVLFLRN